MSFPANLNQIWEQISLSVVLPNFLTWSPLNQMTNSITSAQAWVCLNWGLCIEIKLLSLKREQPALPTYMRSEEQTSENIFSNIVYILWHLTLSERYIIKKGNINNNVKHIEPNTEKIIWLDTLWSGNFI